ncbi:MAG: hypothetical protein EBZ48_10030 [Proteobacteria bacterium]|nr:hypothetical protein [Pseudomonadota bacterium]
MVTITHDLSAMLHQRGLPDSAVKEAEQAGLLQGTRYAALLRFTAKALPVLLAWTFAIAIAPPKGLGGVRSLSAPISIKDTPTPNDACEHDVRAIKSKDSNLFSQVAPATITLDCLDAFTAA